MTTLPRGILQAKYKLSDGTTVNKYRVRINRADFKADKYFDELREAQAFLALSKLKRGKAIIYDLDEKLVVKKAERLDKTNFTLSYIISLYKQQYLPLLNDFTELQQRNRNNKISFLKTIENTSIQNRYMTDEEAESLGIDILIDDTYYTSFGSFDIRQIGFTEINYYVEQRLKKVSKITVQREVTSISNLFSKLRHLNPELKDLRNQTYDYDKSLTANSQRKRTFTYSEEDEKLLFDMLSSVKNSTYFNVAKISFLTGLRRSEALMLNNKAITGNVINLESKGKIRDVYITPEAKDFISSLPFNKETGRFFSLKICSFDKMFREICSRKETTKHLSRFHDIRRTNISRLITKIGIENSVIVSQILGISNVANLEKTYATVKNTEAPTTQKEALKSFGHSYAQTTKGYFNFNVHNIIPKVTK